MLLSKQTLNDLQYEGFLDTDSPERVLQFGEGAFLRAFADYFIDILNEKTSFHGRCVIVQPRSKNASISQKINAQDGLYTLYMRGSERREVINRKRIISSVSRCLNFYSDEEAIHKIAVDPNIRFVVSNTTEAGICYDPEARLTDNPPASFPAKVTKLLYERFLASRETQLRGWVFLPCELIDKNGDALKKHVLQHAADWALGDEFVQWIHEENVFCSTMVDRIVPGYPESEARKFTHENGYEDALMVSAEAFAFWVIQGPEWLRSELPFPDAHVPAIYVDDLEPYRLRKVRILNGAHTSIVAAAYLSGLNIVRDCMKNSLIRAFYDKITLQEIVPTIPLDRYQCISYVDSVTDRFENPYIDHQLYSITLNFTSKWKARILPTILDYLKLNGKLPECLTASFACYLAYYRIREVKDGICYGSRGDRGLYELKDDPKVLEFFQSYCDLSRRSYVRAICQNTDFWGMDLSDLPEFLPKVNEYLRLAEEEGMEALITKALSS